MISLRKASIHDLDLLEYWDRQQHVIDSDPEGDWNWGTELKRDLPWREQLIAESDGRPIGFVQVIDPKLEETHYWGEVEANLRAIDIWIGEASDLNQGYGTEMMKLTIDRCFERKKVKSILIDPLKTNTGAHIFYRRFGFEVIEEREFDGIPSLIMRLDRSGWHSFSTK